MTTRLGDPAESDIENADERVSVVAGGDFGNLDSSIVLSTYPNPSMANFQSRAPATFGAALPTNSARPTGEPACSLAL